MKIKPLYEYISYSVQNEVAVNDYYMELLGRRNIRYGFPGVSKLAEYKLDSWFVEILLFLLCFFWPIFLSPLVNFYFLVKSLKFKLGLKECPKNIFPHDLLFVSGNTTKSVLKKAVGENDAVLYRPRQKKEMVKECGFDSLQLLSALNVLGVYWKSVYYTIRFSYDRRFSNNRLYSIFFFDLIVVARVFEKVGKLDALYTGDHFDRWAVLLDLISGDKARIGKFSVVQHGGLKDSNGHFPIKLAVKLKSVDHLYCYDEGSYCVFKNSIIDGGKEFSVKYFKNSIALSEVTDFDGATVLIVGSSLCFDFHIEVYKSLFIFFGDNLRVFYKPHPTQELKNTDKEDWQIILDPYFFPKVDLVISYPSTLVEQYKEHNIPVIVHSISATQNEIELLIFESSSLLKLKSYSVSELL